LRFKDLKIQRFEDLKIRKFKDSEAASLQQADWFMIVVLAILV